MTLAPMVRRTCALTLSSILALYCAAVPSNKGDKKDKTSPAGQTVDSGSFGIFIKGQRVATETFSVQQQNGTSVIQSQIKEASGADSVSQKSSLEVTASGDLIRYEWNQSSGGSLTVLPNNDFLIEKISTGAGGKTAEQPFLMPSSSPILDNNFFVHREVLLWRYLAADCKSEGGGLKCQQGPVEFGTLGGEDV